MNNEISGNIYTVILAGGQGTRLWPLSTPDHPKPFVPLGNLGTLYGQTVRRAAALSDRVAAVAEPSLATFCEFPGVRFLPEPAPRNTAPAVALAGVEAMGRVGDAGVLVVLPADHWISTGPEFGVTLRSLAASCLESGALGVIGIRPDYPETGYGYIEGGTPTGECRKVIRFVEKPDRPDAERMVRDGNFFWNSGMFVFPVRALRSEMSRHCPGFWEAAEAWAERGDRDPYLALEKISIDYALMEKTDRILMAESSFSWNDVGNFRSLHALLPKDAFGNAVWGPGLVENCRGCLLITRRRETLLRNLEGLAYVEGEGGTLATPIDGSEGIRGGVEALLKSRGR